MLTATLVPGKGDQVVIAIGFSEGDCELLLLGNDFHISRKTHGAGLPDNVRIVVFVGMTDQDMHEALVGTFGARAVVAHSVTPSKRRPRGTVGAVNAIMAMRDRKRRVAHLKRRRRSG